MENIGKLLKERRLELGLTVEDISEKTRLTVKHIHALEDGDISYFKDDLTYLRFFLRSYCNALGMDFDEIKDELRESIDDYTMTYTLHTQQIHEAMEESISNKSKKLGKEKEHTEKKAAYTLPPRHKSRRRVDISLISFLIIVLIVVLGLVYTFVVRMQDKTQVGQTDLPQQEETTVVPPKEELPKKEEPKVEEEEQVEIAKETANSYAVSGIKEEEEVVFEIKFQSKSWFAATQDGKAMNEPVAKVYEANETIQIKLPFKDATKLQFTFGYMAKNTITVNGKEVELDASVKDVVGKVTLDFTLKGEKES